MKTDENIVLTIMDPETGEELTFQGETEADVEDSLEKYFGKL